MRRLLFILSLAAWIGCSESTKKLPEPALQVVQQPPGTATSTSRAGTAPLPLGQWRNVECQPYGLEVSLPGQPRSFINEDQIQGHMIRSVTYEIRNRDGTEYTVSIAELPDPNGKDPQKLLDAAQRALVASPNGTLLDELAVAFEKFPGRQVTIVHPRGTMWARLYLLNDRLVQLAAFNPDKTAADAHDVDRFLNSLRRVAQGS